ncbi:hypothetical protein SEUCBS139899_010254 [Sporothrix eucalyptigena]|uniref:Cytochrome P450 n=1 Tax=Sporothrix eucalyptigena TaxID=1812306 RepID=A0ABP0BJT7_9PEZI
MQQIINFDSFYQKGLACLSQVGDAIHNFVDEAPQAAIYGVAILSTAFLFVATHTIWLMYFHPLSAFPGPKSAAISNIFNFRTIVSGRSVWIIKALHEKYGDVVRLGPNELSFATADAWKDIYDRRKDGKILIKDPKFYRVDDTYRAKHIVTASDPEEHAQMRKMMSHAFSSKALLDQEDVIQHYANGLVDAIYERCTRGPMNLVDFFNWTTFDILGEMAFGESFGSLKNRQTDSWIAIVLDSVKFTAWGVAILKLPLLVHFEKYIFPKHVLAAGHTHAIQSKNKILKRAEMHPERPDFASYILAKREALEITDWELAAHANALIVAGSETSATTLNGLFNYLTNYPDVYAKLKQEIRGAFSVGTEITAARAAALPYLTACLEETMRIYPPIPNGMPRVTPPEGCFIDGRWVPGNTVVSLHMWAVTHNPVNFKEPNVFRPERWLEKTDRLDASKPFLVGPRMCMGINMAWIEIRILAAKLVYHFDFEMINKRNWCEGQQCYTLWQKPAQWMTGTPAQPRPIPTEL